MITTYRTLLAALLLAASLASGTAHATAYTFAETFDSGSLNANGEPTTVTAAGSFNGTADGNLITALSNFTLSFNGIVIDPATLFISAYNNRGYYDSNAVLSFDGLQNNLLLSNSSDPAAAFPSTALATLTGVGSQNYDFAYNDTVIGSNQDFNTILHVTEATAVPEPASLAILALSITALLAVRRRNRLPQA